MKKVYFIILAIVLCCKLGVCAQSTNELFVKDTIEFTASKVVPEPNPNNQEFIFSLFSPDGNWKVQLNYHAESMYGSFDDEDFRLSGEGKNYNFIRNPKNDMSFYSFRHLDATVMQELTTTKIEANGLINVWGEWTRVLVHASYENVAPEREKDINLGRAYVSVNDMFGNSVIEGTNDDYSLRFGLMSGLPEAGKTYYMADLLKPEFVELQSGDTIEPISAELIVSALSTTEHMDMVLQLLTKDLTQYNISMYLSNEAVVARDSIQLDLGSQNTSLNYHDIYNMFQLVSYDEDYAVTISIRDGSQGKSNLTTEDLVLPYSAVVKQPLSKNPVQISIVDAEVEMLKAADGLSYNVYARLIGQDAILYKVNMVLPLDGFVPDGKDTVYYDFGENVLAVYYNHEETGMLTLGAAIENKVQARLTFFSPLMESDTIASTYFDMDVTDLTFFYQKPNGGDTTFYRMVDGKAARMMITHEDDLVHFNCDLLCINDTLYRLHIAYRQPSFLMHDSGILFSAEDEEVSFIDILLGEESGYDLHQLVLSDIQTDEDGYSSSEGFQAQFTIFNDHKKNPYLAGDYGLISGGMIGATMVYVQESAEIVIGAEAATVSIDYIDRYQVKTNTGQMYQINLYGIDFRILGKNGLIYSGEGEQYCYCVTTDEKDNIYFVELDEATADIIVTELKQQGIKVRKVLRNGRFSIESEQGNYQVNGQKRSAIINN